MAWYSNISNRLKRVFGASSRPSTLPRQSVKSGKISTAAVTKPTEEPVDLDSEPKADPTLESWDPVDGFTPGPAAINMPGLFVDGGLMQPSASADSASIPPRPQPSKPEPPFEVLVGELLMMATVDNSPLNSTAAGSDVSDSPTIAEVQNDDSLDLFNRVVNSLNSFVLAGADALSSQEWQMIAEGSKSLNDFNFRWPGTVYNKNELDTRTDFMKAATHGNIQDPCSAASALNTLFNLSSEDSGLKSLLEKFCQEGVNGLDDIGIDTLDELVGLRYRPGSADQLAMLAGGPVFKGYLATRILYGTGFSGAPGVSENTTIQSGLKTL